MPRGIGDRFDDSSNEADEQETDAGSEHEPAETTTETELESEEANSGTERRSSRQRPDSVGSADSSSNDTDETDDELNTREDWDSATVYIEPGQSETMEVTFARLRKQLKRDDVTLEKSKHFYRGIFEIAFDECEEKAKQRIKHLARQDADQ